MKRRQTGFHLFYEMPYMMALIDSVHATDRPGSIFDLCANLDIDQHLFVGVAAVLLANSISSFPTTLTQDNNSKTDNNYNNNKNLRRVRQACWTSCD